VDARWTLDELSRRCSTALARGGVQQDNGQVADVPNGRAIRWYTSTGLLARPAQRGRVAFYGPVHLQQLVAIKRLQASGLALSAIQQALAGTSDADVAALAAVPADLLLADASAAEDTVTVTETAAYRPFWAADVADAAVPPPALASAVPAASASASAPADLPTPSLAPPSARPRVVVDVGGVTVIVPAVDGAQLPLLHEAAVDFVRTLVARGLLATLLLSTSLIHPEGSDR